MLYLPTPPSRSPLPSGRKWVFLGDSITNGSSASNVVYAFPTQSLLMAGTANHSINSLFRGTPGQTSAQIAARFDTDVAANGAEGVVILAGTNDAAQSVSIDTFATNMTSMFVAALALGIPVVACTVPPRSSSVGTSTTRKFTAAYNTWLRMFAPKYGVKIAETYTALADATTGHLAAAYDSGDGVHPNTLGHIQMARKVAAVLASVAGTRPSLVNGVDPLNGMTNPLNTGAGTQPTSSYEQPGGTGTAPTYSIVNDASGLLQFGRWAQMDFDAVSGGTRKYAFGNSASFSVGDVLAVMYRLAVDDVSGTLDANFVAGTGLFTMNTLNQSAVNVANETPCPGPFYAPFLRTFTVPAGMTSLILWESVTVPTGSRLRVRIGEFGVFNLTTLGLKNLVV